MISVTLLKVDSVFNFYFFSVLRIIFVLVSINFNMTGGYPCSYATVIFISYYVYSYDFCRQAYLLDVWIFIIHLRNKVIFPINKNRQNLVTCNVSFDFK